MELYLHSPNTPSLSGALLKHRFSKSVSLDIVPTFLFPDAAISKLIWITFYNSVPTSKKTLCITVPDVYFKGINFLLFIVRSK
jgi:hypothetical protein